MLGAPLRMVIRLKFKSKSMILSILLVLSLSVSLSYASDPGPVKFTVVKDFPDVMYAGRDYEAEYLLENVANRRVPVAFNVTIEGPDLRRGEFTVSMTLDDESLDVYEALLGVFRVKHDQELWLDPKSRSSLLVGVSSVPNLKPDKYEITVELCILVGRILMAVGRFTNHVDAMEEAGVTVDFIPTENATIAVIDLEGNPYPDVSPPAGLRSLDRYVDVSTDAVEFTATIRLYYSDDEVAAAGLVESSLRLYYFDGSAWRRCEETGVNTDENYVWANVTHFTPFAAFGEVYVPPRPRPPRPTYVRSRARFEVSNLKIKPETVYAGEEVEVSVLVSNVGGRGGKHNVTLTVNGTLEGSVNVYLGAGESKTVTFKLVKAEPGTYLVEVDGLTGIFIVEERPAPPPGPAEFMVRGLTISPSTVYPGEPVTVRVEVLNTGESAGNHTVRLLINGTLEASEMVTLEAGESVPVTFTFSPPDTGVYVVEVDGLRGSFTAITPPPPLKPAEFIVSDLSISPEEVGPDETVTVSVTVTNVGDLEGSYNVTLRVDGAIEAVETVTLAGGESTVVVFNVSRTDPGTYSVSVDGLEGVFTVSAPPPPPYPAYAAGAAIIIISIIGAVVLRRRRRR